MAVKCSKGLLFGVPGDLLLAVFSCNRSLKCVPWELLQGGLPGGSDSEESTYNAGGLASVLGQEDALEEGLETHSRIPAWGVPWKEEPGGLQSEGSQGVGHS